ncbi:hypothetical protein [Streptomyces clavuligerus]|uniref:hypothetical protein n=1 Tax=Streptomyces clavuligerus TaxID=1901 RepID=UPI00017FF68E|nr:hypothetical protein [Streptomyces clavuligerus]EDY49261.1 hypothetical protein SSCG_02289 [Streptomyces clavuligerus]WDN56165.1 hypothetical protein LL058_30375 [Streptomyces clavuligerus]
MTVTRQVTRCTAPSILTVTRLRRTGTPITELHVCHAHRAARATWPGTTTTASADAPPCGTLKDTRPPYMIAREHLSLWGTAISLTGDTDGLSLDRRLRACADGVLEYAPFGGQGADDPPRTAALLHCAADAAAARDWHTVMEAMAEAETLARHPLHR